MKKKIILLLILILMVVVSGCQDGERYMTIQGEVINNNTQEPVSGAKIDLNKYSTQTNAQGVFQIKDIPVVDEDKLSTKDKVLTVTASGYKTVNKVMNVKEGTHTLTIKLAKRNEDKFFYTKQEEGQKNIYLSSISATESEKVLSNAWSPNFSKERNELLYLSDKNGNINIYRYNLKAKESKQITNTKVKKKAPSWLNDKVLYASKRDGNYNIYKTTLNGDELIRLTDNKGYNSNPVFIPETNLIAYISEGNKKYKRVHIMNKKGKKNRIINTALSNDYFLKAHQGKVYFNNQQDKIIVINTNGSGKKVVYQVNTGQIKDFDIEKDNLLLINRKNKFKIKLLNTNNNQIKTLIENENKLESPNWKN